MIHPLGFARFMHSDSAQVSTLIHNLFLLLQNGCPVFKSLFKRDKKVIILTSHAHRNKHNDLSYLLLIFQLLFHLLEKLPFHGLLSQTLRHLSPYGNEEQLAANCPVQTHKSLQQTSLNAHMLGIGT